MEEFDFPQGQRIVRENVTRLCQEPGAAELLLEELQRLAAIAEEVLQQGPAGDRSLIACGPGCGTCCVVNVSVLIPEGLTIVRYLRRQDEAQRQTIAAKLETLWCEVRGLDDEDRIFLQRPCAFLDDDGCCRIYPVRPLLCRSITSTDAQQCRETMARKVFGEETPVLMHQLQRQLYECLFAGFAEGLEAGGGDGRSFQLTGLVRLLWEEPERERDLLAGRRLSWEELY